jgi:hypothetical protein
MDLKSLVESLTIKEREELLTILSDSISTWTTMPPHIKEMLEGDDSEDKQDFVMNKSSSNTRSRQAVKAGNNTWVDTGESREIETPEINKTPRNRKPPQKKSVRCHICGKERKVNAALIYGEYYRCDSCTGNR